MHTIVCGLFCYNLSREGIPRLSLLGSHRSKLSTSCDMMGSKGNFCQCIYHRRICIVLHRFVPVLLNQSCGDKSANLSAIHGIVNWCTSTAVVFTLLTRFNLLAVYHSKGDVRIFIQITSCPKVVAIVRTFANQKTFHNDPMWQ